MAVLTQSGREAAALPVLPVWYNAFAEAEKLGCLSEMYSLAALCSTQNPIFIRPFSVRHASDALRPAFFDGRSDHLTLVNAYLTYTKVKLQGKVAVEQWCKDSFLSPRVLDEVDKIRAQLADPARVTRCKSLRFGDESFATNPFKALARSFFHQAAFKQRKGIDAYKVVHAAEPAILHPDSALVGGDHEWVVYDSFAHTSMPYLEIVTAVKAEWLMVSSLYYLHFYILTLLRMLPSSTMICGRRSVVRAAPN